MNQFDNLNLYCIQANGVINDEFANLQSELIKLKDFEELNSFLKTKYNITTEKKKNLEFGNKSLQLIFEDKRTVLTYYNSYDKKGKAIIFKNPKYLAKT